ncbi:MAG: hypothetical protein PVSMB7_04620 [Chloroflexota bacterium]
MPVRLARVGDLVDPDALRPIVGSIVSIERAPLETSGFSGARHERVSVRSARGDTISFVLKHIRPAADWTAYRTGDRHGREGLLLAESALDGIWDIFHSPFHAFALEPGAVGLLMDDLTGHLIPDRAGPLDEQTEDLILRSLAALHARYWQSDVLRLPWLTPFATRLAILGPGAAGEESARASPYPLFATVQRGWKTALERLGPAARALLLQSPQQIARRYSDLPQTLLHGDPRLANFATLPGERVAAFDWAVIGVGPAAMDLGHYLAINAARLARSREGVMARYRALLEQERGSSLPDPLWDMMRSAAIVCGAAVLLWTKGLALESGSPQAEHEWRWWAGWLETLAEAEGQA